MAIDQILTKIMDQANLEAKTIMDSATKEADSIVEEAKREADLLKEKIISDCRQNQESEFRKTIINKKLSVQKSELAEKKAQIESSFLDALSALTQLKDDTYNKLLSAMFSKLHIKDEFEIFIAKKDTAKINKDFIRRANPNLKVYKFSIKDDIKGGFIIKTKDLIIDNSIETILNDAKMKIESNVAGILFKEE